VHALAFQKIILSQSLCFWLRLQACESLNQRSFANAGFAADQRSVIIAAAI
jgi:hypothetical protein